MKPIPEWFPEEAILTIEEFEDAVINGFFIDYDGSGEYSNGKEVFEDSFVQPSTFKRSEIPEGATHVLWYNR